MSARSDGAKPTTDTRTLILDATEQIMLEEGYPGVSSRKVAAKAGLGPKLLHYYFKTMDDLFIASFQRTEEWYAAKFASATASDRPLHELWELGLGAAGGKLILEYNAVARHRPAVREIIAKSARWDRIIVSSALGSIFEKYGIDQELLPPKVAALLMAGLARAMATENALGVDEGHAEAIAFVREIFARFEPPAKPRRRSKSLVEHAPASE